MVISLPRLGVPQLLEELGDEDASPESATVVVSHDDATSQTVVVALPLTDKVRVFLQVLDVGEAFLLERLLRKGNADVFEVALVTGRVHVNGQFQLLEQLDVYIGRKDHVALELDCVEMFFSQNTLLLRLIQSF